MRISVPSLLVSIVCFTANAASPKSTNPKPVSGPITLEQAYDLALSSDQSIRKAFLEVRKADLLPLSALTKLTPRLNGSYSYDRSETKISPVDGPFRDSRKGNSGASLSLDQPLIDFSAFPARRRGKIEAQSSRYARSFTIRETLFGVADAYYEVLKQERLLEVNRQSLELASQQEQLAQKRADVGEVTRSDVLRAQVSVETARRGLIASENTLELSRNTLRNILNLSPDAPLRLVEPPAYNHNKQAFDELLQTAWQKREDLMERALAIQESEERRKEIIAQYGPKVVASADRSFARSSGTGAGNTEAWSAGISVQIPFFTGGQREIDLATSRYNIDQSVLEKERLSKTIEAQVKQAWLAVRALDSSLRATQVQLQAAEQGYTDIQNQYSAGIAKSVDVLSALKDLNSARADLAGLTLDYQVALRSLEQVTGTFQESRVKQASVK